MRRSMTNEEAVINFRNTIAIEPHIKEAHRLAISALEKQIPKKPKRIEYVDGGAEDDCPNCGKRICMVFGNGDTFRWQMPYCCDCGQALKWDWAEGEERRGEDI